jgi:hypothetical protein
VAQTSGVDPDESWGWPCPYCRAHNPVEAVACANCGSQLRDPDDDDLFTTVAADNAEVVPPDAPFGRDNMWTTDANGADGGDVDEGEVVDDDLWDPVPTPGPSASTNGFAFSAEPAPHPADVIDEPFHVDEPAPTSPRVTGNLFSSTSNGTANGSTEAGTDGGRSPFAAPGGAEADPWAPQDRWNGTANGWGAPPPGYAPAPGPFAAPQPAPAPQPGPAPGYDPSGGHWQYSPAPQVPPPPNGQESHHAPVPDQHGLSAAVGRLRPEEQERAAVPITVCGALLQHDEVVLAAVTGQMLGHSAVVVLTNRRVLVVNGRRWQPIVDVFDVGPNLTVRGRHDRDVAALTFSDDVRLSTVDGIGEVGLAVELAERIRGG